MPLKAKLVTAFAAVIVLATIVMGVSQTYFIRTYFSQTAIDQMKLQGEQIEGLLQSFETSIEDSELAAEVASWVYVNTGLRTLITAPNGEVVVDSHGEESLVGKVVQSDLLEDTLDKGEINAFDIPLAGKGQVAISVPWRIREAVSGSLVLVAPLKDMARQATNEIEPFFKKAGLAGSSVALVGALIISHFLPDAKSRQTG